MKTLQTQFLKSSFTNLIVALLIIGGKPGNTFAQCQDLTANATIQSIEEPVVSGCSQVCINWGLIVSQSGVTDITVSIGIDLGAMSEFEGGYHGINGNEVFWVYSSSPAEQFPVNSGHIDQLCFSFHGSIMNEIIPVTFTTNNGQCDVLLLTGKKVVYNIPYFQSSSAGTSIQEYLDLNGPNLPDLGDACENNIYREAAFSGKLNVDIDYCFDGSIPYGDELPILHFNTSSSIHVKNNSKLTLKNFKLTACQNTWKGIIVDPGSELEMIDCTIEFAETAVELKKSSMSSFASNQFLHNNIGIYANSIGFAAPGSEPSPAQIYISKFTENLFESGLKKHGNQAFETGQYGEAAIKSDLVTLLPLTSLSSAQPNIVRDYQTGINSRNSYVSLSNFEIYDMRYPPGVPSASAKGIGIILTSSTGYGGLLAFGSTSHPILIHDCVNMGIDLKEANHFISGVNMNDLPIGINVRGGSNAYGQITDCTIYADKTGIALANGIFKQSVIKSNYITIPHNSVAEFGILANNMKTPNSSSFIQILNNNIVSNGKGGIYLNRPTRFHVLDNSILGGSGSSAFAGIDVFRPSSLILHCNDLTSELTSDPASVGIRVDRGINVSSGCNSVNKSYYGFQFLGPTNGVSELSTNTMLDHTVGIQIGSNADPDSYIKPQMHHGNLWADLNTTDNNGTTTGLWGVKFDGGSQFLLNNLFAVDPYDDYRYVPSATPNEIIIPEFYNYQTPVCTPTNDCDGANIGSTLPSFRFSRVDTLCALGELTTTNPASVWLIERDLYAVLHDFPEVRTANDTFATFYTNASSTTVGLVDALERDIQLMMSGDSSVAESIDQIQMQIQNLQGQMVLLDTLTNETLYDQLREVIQDSIAGLAETLWTLRLTADSLLKAQASTLFQSSASIPTSDAWVYNLVKPLRVYLNLKAQGVDTLSANQSLVLFSIADQCPSTGGDGVFLARALLFAYRDTLILQDDGECQQANPAESDTAAFPLVLGVYPNPGIDKVHIWVADLKQQGIVQVVDLMGRMIIQQSVDAGAAFLELNTSQLNPGMYVISLISDGEVSRKTMWFKQ